MARPPYQPGDYVWCYEPKPGPADTTLKLAPRYGGPYRTERLVLDGRAFLAVRGETGKGRARRVDNAKPYTTAPRVTFETVLPNCLLPTTLQSKVWIASPSKWTALLGLPLLRAVPLARLRPTLPVRCPGRVPQFTRLPQQ